MDNSREEFFIKVIFEDFYIEKVDGKDTVKSKMSYDVINMSEDYDKNLTKKDNMEIIMLEFVDAGFIPCSDGSIIPIGCVKKVVPHERVPHAEPNRNKKRHTKFKKKTWKNDSNTPAPSESKIADSNSSVDENSAFPIEVKKSE
jgi:hypothetical protein